VAKGSLGEQAAPASLGTGVGADWRVLAALYAAVLGVVLLPLLLVDVPALVDYPNHLARMRILSDLDASPDLQAIYRATWAFLPNLAMDAVVPRLARMTGVIWAAKLFVALTLAVNLAGMAVLHRAVFGRFSLWPLAGSLVLYNYVLALGFLNYLFGIGICLLLFAFWIGSREIAWPWRLLIGALGAVVLLLCHLAAFATYGLCVIAYELGRWLRSRPLDWAIAVQDGLLAAAQLVPAIILYLVAVPSTAARLDLAYDPTIKLLSPLVPGLFYHQLGDFAYVAALLALLALAILLGKLRFSPDLRWSAIGLGLCVLAVPTWAMGNWGNDFRLMAPLLFLAVAGTTLEVPRRAGVLLMAVALILLGGRVFFLSTQWRNYDSLYAELRGVAADLERGARILPAVADWRDVGRIAPNGYPRVFYHAAALLAVEAPVFVPTLFTAEGRQPLSVRPAYRAIDAPHVKPMPIDLLVAAADPSSRDVIFRSRTRDNAYYYRFAGWPEQFDYVLMLDFGVSRNPMPERLKPVHSGSYFTLYAIVAETPMGHSTPADAPRRGQGARQ
jgi:hypothetical protein